MALVFFPVSAVLKAIRTDSVDEGGDPDIQFISSTVWFTPSTFQVFSALDLTIYRLQPIRARTDVSDGVLRTINGDTVKLPANSAAVGLDELLYSVEFTDVVYDTKVTPDPLVQGFQFVAPVDSTEVKLATVPRLPLPRDRTR